jgi:hypothetical protein
MKKPITLSSVKKLKLEDGDTLVVNVPDKATQENLDQLKDLFQQAFPDNQVLIHSGLKLSVIKKEVKRCKNMK